MKSANFVSEGITYSLLIPAVFTLITGGILSVFLLIPGLILLGLGIYLFTVTGGFELNASEKRYRSYKRLFGLNWGNWQSFDRVKQVEIWLSSESKTLRTLFPTGSPAYYNNSRSTLKSITYDLILVNDSGEHLIAFEFLSYKKALAALRMIENQLQFPIRDRIAEKLAENQLKRQQRR